MKFGERSFISHRHGSDWKMGLGKFSPAKTKKIIISEMESVIKYR